MKDFKRLGVEVLTQFSAMTFVFYSYLKYNHHEQIKYSLERVDAREFTHIRVLEICLSNITGPVDAAGI